MTYSDILNRKQELMGFAIIWIFLFHSKFGQNLYIIKDVIGFGAHGVDIFFFLSALGLSHSLKKNSNTLAFYSRRFWRIVPTFLFFLIVVHLVGLSLDYPHPKTLFQGLCWYSTIGWWINGLFSDPYCYFYEWYIPTLILFYAFAPILYKCSIKSLFTIMVLSTILSLIFSYFGILETVYWSYQRVAIYVEGFLFYKLIKNHSLGRFSKKMLLASFSVGVILLLFSSHLSNEQKIFTAAIYRCSMVLGMPVFLHLLSATICRTPFLQSFLCVCGTLSLELYLLHIYNRPLSFVRNYILENKSLSIILTFFILIVLAYIINSFIKIITSRTQMLFKYKY